MNNNWKFILFISIYLIITVTLAIFWMRNILRRQKQQKQHLDKYLPNLKENDEVLVERAIYKMYVHKVDGDEVLLKTKLHKKYITYINPKSHLLI